MLWVLGYSHWVMFTIPLLVLGVQFYFTNPGTAWMLMMNTLALWAIIVR